MSLIKKQETKKAITEEKDLDIALIEKIKKQAINEFVANFQIGNLFALEEETGLGKFIPIIGIILNIIILIILITK